MASNFPEIGRWIKCSIATHEFTCKVCSYVESVEAAIMNFSKMDSDPLFDKEVEVQYLDGDSDQFSMEDLRRYNWSYVETPSEENLKTAAIQSDNVQRQISCAFCKSNTTELKSCKACKKVY